MNRRTDSENIHAAVEAGFDMSLVEASLRLSHQARALRHQAALTLALEFERAGKALRDHERLESAAETIE